MGSTNSLVLVSLQSSGLPLKLSAKFQINMAMSDVRSMAHVEKFSHLTIPMLWFEIGMEQLPDRLQKRFSLYLNILPTLQTVGLYGSFILGAIFSIMAVSRVALRTTKSMTSQRCHEKFSQNLHNNSVYNPCEEKLIDLKSTKKLPQVIKVDESNKSDSDSNDECSDVITRSQYELEDDDALSDIDYNEMDDESTSSCSVSVSWLLKLLRFLLFRYIHVSLYRAT